MHFSHFSRVNSACAHLVCRVRASFFERERGCALATLLQGVCAGHRSCCAAASPPPSPPPSAVNSGGGGRERAALRTSLTPSFFFTNLISRALFAPSILAGAHRVLSRRVFRFLTVALFRSRSPFPSGGVSRFNSLCPLLTFRSSFRERPRE